MRPGVAHYRFGLNSYGRVSIPREEEVEAYNQCLADVIENPRFYLDNLDRIKEFQVSWLRYGSKEGCKKSRHTYALSYPKGAPFINTASAKRSSC